MRLASTLGLVLAALLWDGCCGGKRKSARRRKAKSWLGQALALTAEHGDDETLNFTQVMEALPLVVVGFIVDCLPEAEPGMTADTLRQCKESQVVKPMLSKLAKRQKSITYAYVDVEAEEELAQQHQAEVAPAVLLFRNGSRASRYPGSLSADDLASWVADASCMRQVGSKAELEAAVKARAKDSVLVAATGPPQVGRFVAEATARTTAEGNNADMRFLFLEEAEDESFTLTLHRGIAEKAQFEVDPGKEYFAEDFVRFVERERVPWFGALTADNAESVLAASAKGVIALCFAAGSAEVDAARHAGWLRRVAQKWKGHRVVHVDLSAGQLPAGAPQCGDTGGHPAVVLWRPAGPGRPASVELRVFEAAEPTEKAVNAFVKEALRSAKGAEL